jgi:hypothetical protein
MQYLRVFRIADTTCSHPTSVETPPLGYASLHIASDDILSQREGEHHSKFPLYHSESLAVSHPASFVSIFISSTSRDPGALALPS